MPIMLHTDISNNPRYFIYYFQDESSPAQSLAHRLRGRLKYVNQKMKMIRSRSAERLRGVYTSGVRSEVIAVDHRGAE